MEDCTYTAAPCLERALLTINISTFVQLVFLEERCCVTTFHTYHHVHFVAWRSKPRQKSAQYLDFYLHHHLTVGITYSPALRALRVYCSSLELLCICTRTR